MVVYQSEGLTEITGLEQSGKSLLQQSPSETQKQDGVTVLIDTETQ